MGLDKSQTVAGWWSRLALIASQVYGPYPCVNFMHQDRIAVTRATVLEQHALGTVGSPSIEHTPQAPASSILH
ncbi:hypothetical protein MDA_GLEAN10013386 [Myotis davidii]|uniref:Uncharacterized protein n=1 Tax=Myotis davidii TaxID=225400 RepID=L5LXY4_MYODS|nr:hypothetical protein MDA_GLEAN10013386 [Myotis davidii]